MGPAGLAVPVVGEEGDPGATGPPGRKGCTGDNGPRGQMGLSGLRGQKGMLDKYNTIVENQIQTFPKSYVSMYAGQSDS